MSNYPAPPDHRLAYDIDGSIGFIIRGGVTTQMTTTELGYWNDEDADAFPGGINQSDNPTYFGIIFPEHRNITAYYVNLTTPDGFISIGNWETSVDTTNGTDGTWVSRTGPIMATGTVAPDYRQSINTVSWTGIKAIRFVATSGSGSRSVNLRTFHLYGTIAAGETPNRLRLWHPTLDQEVSASHFDFGDVMRSTSSDIQFRVKNNSATLNANTITVSTSVPTDSAAPTVASSLTLSNGGAFAATTSAGTLAPGAISGVITLRRTTLATAALSVWAFRVKAAAASWS